MGGGPRRRLRAAHGFIDGAVRLAVTLRLAAGALCPRDAAGGGTEGGRCC